MSSRAEEKSLEALLATRPTTAEHAINIVEELYRFSVQRKETDFKFHAGNKTAHCHSPVLCVQSPYFHALCSRGMREATLDPCVGPREDGLALLQTVRYLYLGSMELTEDIVEPVVKAAQDINHQALLKYCEKYIINMLNIHNFPKLSAVAKRYALRELAKACEQLQTSKFSALLRTHWFLPSLTINDLRKHLQDDHLSVSSEDQVLDGVIEWLKMKRTVSEKKQQEFADTLAPLVRLSQCNTLKLEALVKDQNIHAFFRLQVSEFLRKKHLRSHEKARTAHPTSSDTRPMETISPSPTTHARMMTTRPHADITKANIVVIGGRITGNKAIKDIMYLDQHEGNTHITEAKLCDRASLYSVCAHADNIIISGGFNKSLKKTVSGVHQFNFTSLEWIVLPDLPYPRTRHASLLTRHKLYIMFGMLEEDNEFKRWYQQVIVLDLVTRTWSSLKNSPYALYCPSVAEVNEDIYAMGGLTSDSTWSKRTMKYSPRGDTWTECQNMPSGNQCAVSSTLAVNNRIFTLMREEFLVYDTQQDQWSRLEAPMIQSFWCAMVLINDTLMAIGGYEESNKNPHGCLQSYNLRTRKWSLLEESMPKPLSFHSAIVLPHRP